MKERLIRLLDSEQLSASKFADKIGVQRSSVSHVLSGRNKPSYDFLQKTLISFPGLSSEWLLLGQGEMMTGMPDYTGATLFDSSHRQMYTIRKLLSNSSVAAMWSESEWDAINKSMSWSPMNAWYSARSSSSKSQ